MTSFIRFLLVSLLCLSAAQSVSAAEKWRVVSMQWEPTCAGFGSGMLEWSRKLTTFRASQKHCSNASSRQHNRLRTAPFPASRAVTYMFESNISFQSTSRQSFVLFQVHAGRATGDCAPPMSLRWQGNNTFSFDSDYNSRAETDRCVENRQMRNARYSGPRLRRDGTEYKLQVRLDFDGKGGFRARVLVDGAAVLEGTFGRPANLPFAVPREFRFNHGVFSNRVWPFEMQSRNMRVLRLKG